MQDCKVNILGTEYSIKFKNDEEVCADMGVDIGSCGGYCNGFSHEIVVANLNCCNDSETAKANLKKTNMRHEITHGFLNESGLCEKSNDTDCWAKNEEMIDWIAIQFPKMLKAFNEVGAL